MILKSARSLLKARIITRLKWVRSSEIRFEKSDFCFSDRKAAPFYSWKIRRYVSLDRSTWLRNAKWAARLDPRIDPVAVRTRCPLTEWSRRLWQHVCHHRMLTPSPLPSVAYLYKHDVHRQGRTLEALSFNTRSYCLCFVLCVCVFFKENFLPPSVNKCKKKILIWNTIIYTIIGLS